MGGKQWFRFLAVLHIALTICVGAGVKETLYDIEVDVDRFLDTQTVSASTVSSQNDPSTIDVAAFNVKVLGVTKASSTFVMEKLATIVLRYDLILIQEIRDASQNVIQTLLNNVNFRSGSTSQYALLQSERLGRTSSKEQYAFLYRSDIFTTGRSYVYDDSSHDVFEREPFVVEFKSSVTAISSFIAIAIHTSPKDATSEIDRLVDVYDNAKRTLGTSDAIIMGDFNAACSYVSEWSSIRLATDPRFYWLINDVEDTTSSNTECAYDRLVVAGSAMINAVSPLSPSVFHYDREFGLSFDDALKVSDHYPVQMKIKSKLESERIGLTRMIKVEDKESISAVPIVPPNHQNYASVDYLHNSTGGITGFILKFPQASLSQSMANLQKLKVEMGQFVSSVQINSAQQQLRDLSMINFLPKNNRVYKTLRDYYHGVLQLYTVMAKCEIDKKRCIVMEEVYKAF